MLIVDHGQNVKFLAKFSRNQRNLFQSMPIERTTTKLLTVAIIVMPSKEHNVSHHSKIREHFNAFRVFRSGRHSCVTSRLPKILYLHFSCKGRVAWCIFWLVFFCCFEFSSFVDFLSSFVLNQEISVNHILIHSLIMCIQHSQYSSIHSLAQASRYAFDMEIHVKFPYRNQKKVVKGEKRLDETQKRRTSRRVDLNWWVELRLLINKN